MRLKTLIAASVFASSFASATTAKLPKFEGHVEDIPSAENFPYSQEDFQKEMAAATKRSARAVASDANYESAMSKELKDLRSQILAIRSADQLDKQLTALAAAMDAIDKQDAEKGITRNNPYKGADRDFRYYASQILPLQCMKGIVWRFTPLAEKSGVVESRLVTAVRGLASSMQIMLPQVSDLPKSEDRQKAKDSNEQNIAPAVFDYVTLPYERAVLFTEDFQLQEHLMNSCYTALRKSNDRLERLDLNSPIVWDNKMATGVGTFPDDLDRYKLVGEAERHVALAEKNAGMHFITFTRSYRIKDYFALQTALNKLYVDDAFSSVGGGFGSIDGVSMEKRAKKIRSFSQTFTIYEDGPRHLKTYAWPHMVRAIQEWNYAWAEVKDKPENQRAILNPAVFNAGRRPIGEILNTWLRVTQGPTALHSRLTNRTVTFDLRNFYANPVADLKAFLPNKFDSKSSKYLNNPYKTIVMSGNAEMINDPKYAKYRNWFYGKPVGWDLDTWRRLFPELKSGDELPQAIRTMNQAWGGTSLALPLMPFIR